MPNIITRLRDAFSGDKVYRELAEAKTKKPDLNEYGATGTAVWSGLLSETDYNPDLEPSLAVDIYDKMRKSDGQVKAALLACQLPLMSATWSVEPPTDDAQDVDIAEFVSGNLFDGMTITFDDFMRHTLMMLPFGFSCFEKVFEVRDGKVCWRKFAPRMPKSIYDFGIDDSGGLSSVVQYTTKGSKYEKITIPVEKALVFTLNREGSNFRGESLLRSAYKHWYYKDNLYRIDAMAAERHGMGVAFFQYPSSGGTTTKTSIDAMGQKLHAHQKGYIALPMEGYGFDLKGVNGALHDTMRSIEHHDIQIVRSVLAHFLNLGTGDVGSWALSRDQSSFFLMALEATAKQICGTFNRYAIPQLVDYNFPNVKAYPKLQCSGLQVIDIGIWSKAIADLTAAGAMVTDDEIEGEVRRVLNLPAKPEPKEQAKASEHIHTNNCSLSEKIILAQKEPGQKFMQKLKGVLDKAEQEIVDAVQSIQKKQIENLVEQAVKLLKAGKPEKLKDLDVRYKSEVTSALAKVYTDLYQRGQKDVVSDLGARQTKKLAEPVILEARALATTSVLAAKLKGALMWQALNQVGMDVINEAALKEVLFGLSLKDLTSLAAIGVSEAYNIGRKEEADKHDVQRVYRQALMDGNTCEPCAELHNKEWDFGDDGWRDYEPPDDQRCEGKDKCRCVLVFVGEEGK